MGAPFYQWRDSEPKGCFHLIVPARNRREAIFKWEIMACDTVQPVATARLKERRV